LGGTSAREDFGGAVIRDIDLVEDLNRELTRLVPVLILLGTFLLGVIRFAGGSFSSLVRARLAFWFGRLRHQLFSDPCSM
jgi:hypothetical protein